MVPYGICLGLFLPLLGFLGLITFSGILGRRAAGVIGCTTIFLSFATFCSLLFAYNQGGMSPQEVTLFPWIHVGQINADFVLHLDPLSILMTLIITGVGFLIHVYSIGYMDHDEDVVRFFACMNFFVFAMLLLVLAGDLLVLFIGWEGVGLASYLLIGFWYEKPEAAASATKAFVINRIGDLGFLLGLLLTYQLFGTTHIEQVAKQATQTFAIGAAIITLLTLLYFVGAVGKSAQLPLYTWLPDAMAGPTPVSALIHAATMVTAGVYLVVRMHEVFMLAPITLQIVGAIGGITSLFAALCALAQTDLKRVLAYSTVSQLGLMFLACGVGAFYSAMFHLTTHAFVKALLFLSAGNVVHMLHDTTEMSKMGGLSKIFTKTHWLFLIGTLALSGIPPFAAFFSKDLILEDESMAGYVTLFYIALAASILTGVYLTRAYCLTFRGKNNTGRDDVKEAPQVMLWPVYILGVLSIVGGFIGFGFFETPPLENFIKDVGITPVEQELSVGLHLTWEMILAVSGAVLGVLSTFFVYTRFKDRLGSTFKLLTKSFYVDKLYSKVFVKPLRAVSNFIANILEPKVFDASMRLAAEGTSGAAKEIQQVQSGQIRSYVAWMTLGVVFLIVYLVF